MNHSTPSELIQLAEQARQIQDRLEELWSDEGVDQLAIFLDPDIVTVLAEIKEISLDFVRQVASLSPK